MVFLINRSVMNDRKLVMKEDNRGEPQNIEPQNVEFRSDVFCLFYIVPEVTLSELK